MDICALDDIDPVFLSVTHALYGGAVDPRELWDVAKNMDSSEVHVNGTAKPKKKSKSLVGRALVLGAAAEGAATFRAGQGAYRAVTAPKAIGEAAGKLKSTRSKAVAVGEFGLQAGNLGVGLIAARKLSHDAKKRAAMSKAVLGFLRPVKRVMSDEQAMRHTAALKRTAAMGDKLVAGAALGGTFAVGHRMGRNKGRAEVAKARVAVPPVANVKPINSGGAGAGLGRHGRLIAGKTPAPRLQPVTRPPGLPKPVIANAVVKALTWHGEIAKVDTDQRTVFGWCSVVEVNGEPVVDLQGDWLPLEEVEKSAYRYVIDSRKGGDMHKRVSKADQPLHTADLIESFVVTPDKLEKMGLRPDALPLGWWVGMRVNDAEQWAKVKSKERLGFSIHGTGAREEWAA